MNNTLALASCAPRAPVTPPSPWCRYVCVVANKMLMCRLVFCLRMHVRRRVTRAWCRPPAIWSQLDVYRCAPAKLCGDISPRSTPCTGAQTQGWLLSPLRLINQSINPPLIMVIFDNTSGRLFVFEFCYWNFSQQ